MKKVSVYDQNGKKTEEMTLPQKVFGKDVKTDLLTQYLHVYKVNQRQGTASSKTRSEVSGGGKKPWRQKGTGRARHGSIRSPIWVHGGIAHGPKPRGWKLNFPKKMNSTALASSLSSKLESGDIRVIDNFEFNQPNTKKISELLTNFSLKGRTLFVLSEKNENLIKSIRNFPGMESKQAQNLNAHDVLNCQNLVLDKDAVKILEEKLK